MEADYPQRNKNWRSKTEHPTGREEKLQKTSRASLSHAQLKVSYRSAQSIVSRDRQMPTTKGNQSIPFTK